MQLTKDTDKFLCEIYQEYLTRRKSGMSKSEARSFSAPESLVSEFMQGTLPEDMHDAIQELRKASFVKASIIHSFSLNDDAIIYMENRFKNGLKDVADFISKFIP